MVDKTDNDKESSEDKSDEVQEDVDQNGDSPEVDAQDDSTSENNDENDSQLGQAVGGSTSDSNVIPIDVFEPLGRYRTYLKVLSTCVDELAHEAASSIGSYLRRPVSLSMGEIRVMGQANCQPENSLLNGKRDFFYDERTDGYFYVALTSNMVAYLVELFYGGAVDTLSMEAASPGCLSEKRMREQVAEYFSRSVALQLSAQLAKKESGNGEPTVEDSGLVKIGEQDLIKQQFSSSMLSVMMTLESDGLKCELETGFCINLLEELLGVVFSNSEPVAISDARWGNDLRNSVTDCDLELRCTLAELPVRLGDVQKFGVGDFIPLADLDSVVFSINRRKLFQGQFGVVDEKPSASFKRWI